MKYLQLPLVVQFPVELPENKIFLPLPSTFHLTSGIFGAYLLDAHLEGSNTRAGSDASSEEAFSNDVINQYSKYDGGIMLGTGLEFGTTVKIGVEGRVQYTALQTYNGTPTYRPKNMAVTLALYFLL